MWCSGWACSGFFFADGDYYVGVCEVNWRSNPVENTTINNDSGLSGDLTLLTRVEVRALRGSVYHPRLRVKQKLEVHNSSTSNTGD
jgi:hypothetical protein